MTQKGFVWGESFGRNQPILKGTASSGYEPTEAVPIRKQARGV
jgi:hypothetical protein